MDARFIADAKGHLTPQEGHAASQMSHRAGLWALAETEELRLRDAGTWRSLPLDIYADAGLRIDTDVGIFELTIANALGRLR